MHIISFFWLNFFINGPFIMGCTGQKLKGRGVKETPNPITKKEVIIKITPTMKIREFLKKMSLSLETIDEVGDDQESSPSSPSSKSIAAVSNSFSGMIELKIYEDH